MADSSDQVTLKDIFKSIDTDGSGTLNVEELKTCLGRNNISPDVTAKILAEADADDDGTITEKEFLNAMKIANEKNGKVGELSALVKAQAQLLQISFDSGGVHTYSTEELNAFTDHLNYCLEGDEDLKDLLPIPHVADFSDNLFGRVSNGLILGKFVSMMNADSLDPRALNYPKGDKPLSVFKKNENLNLVIAAVKSMGVQVHNIGAGDVSKVTNPTLVLGLMWQMVKMHLLSDLNLKAHPELIRLLREGESMEDFMKLSAEEILKRWMNFHLEAAGSSKRIKNFSGDVKDSEAYAIVEEQISGGKCKAASVMNHTDKTKRAEQAINNAKVLGCNPIVKPRDIASGNSKLNLAFAADLFNHCPGLEELEEEEMKDLMGLDDDLEGEREELAFRCWANNLGIEDFFLDNLFDGCADGISLLKIIDAVEPGVVVWRKVQNPPKMVFHKNSNHSYAITLLKGMGGSQGIKFSLVGIGGKDITDKKKKLVLSCIWQLFRYHSLKFLASLKDKGNFSDAMILEWANEMVAKVGGAPLSSFKDSKGADGVWACNLVKALDPEVFNDEYVSENGDDESNRLNARYAISVARRHGCMVFLLPDDILECKPKLVLTFAAAVIKKAHNL